MKTNNFEPSCNEITGCCEICIYANVPPRDEPCVSCKWLDLDPKEDEEKAS